jgi:uncharacterized protein (TIGR00730 family)
MITPNVPRFSLTVYCGSRAGNHPTYEHSAREVGRWIGSRGGQLIYGGGGQGLMGIVANETMASGGRVVGIIPQSMVEREWAHHAVDELVIVQSMHERKAQLIERGEALLAISGGIGTLDEFFEAWTWRQLGFHHKRVGLLNTQGYYDTLLAFLGQTVDADFLGNGHLKLLDIHHEVDALMSALLPGH